MKASTILVLGASVLAAANPVNLARDTPATTPDAVLANYQAVADDTVSKLSIFGCDIVGQSEEDTYTLSFKALLTSIQHALRL